MMHRLISPLIWIGLSSLTVQAQSLDYRFTDVVRLEPTTVKDQCMTGTCWSYSTTSFIESELQRTTGQNIDLSEMYNARMTYLKKAEMYLRLHGLHQFGPGSLCHDVLSVISAHGVVPEAHYSGLTDGSGEHDHGDLDALLLAMVETAKAERIPVNDPAWLRALNGVLDAYLGPVPEAFEVDGQTFTPETYRDHLALDLGQYKSLTSFAHHPYGSPFILEVPDNFSRQAFDNVPLADLQSAVLSALDKGYTVAWDADVSEPGFSFREGLAVLLPPEMESLKDASGQIAEPPVTEASRQAGFDNLSTTDDHLMHIIGYAHDQDGDTFLIVKNSWGDGNLHGGFQYVSIPYFQAKTISILLNENGLPRGMR